MNDFDWMAELNHQIKLKTQRKVAAELQVSATMVNQVVNGTYPGSLDTIRIKVEGKYLNSCVSCPVLGDIPVNECLENQQRPFSASNPQRVKVFRACRAGCPNSKLENTARTQRISVAGDAEERYSLDDQLEYCRRMAGGDPLKEVELLRRELSKLANRFNAHQWELRHKKR